MQVAQLKQEVAEQGLGAAGTAATAASASITWIEQANQVVDLVAGVVAIVAGVCTVVWYVHRFLKARGEQANDKTSSSE
jgi:hypothetical protein